MMRLSIDRSFPYKLACTQYLPNLIHTAPNYTKCPFAKALPRLVFLNLLIPAMGVDSTLCKFLTDLKFESYAGA